MKDGFELVVKILNPNAGPTHYTTASEVATIQYVVLTYCSRSTESKLGLEYIVMEKAQGIKLSCLWENLKPYDKLSIVKQIVAHSLRQSSHFMVHYTAVKTFQNLRVLKLTRPLQSDPQQGELSLMIEEGKLMWTEDPDFLKIYQHILPKGDALNMGIIWHNDLHIDNIFVDKHNPTKITSIIDWQAVPIYLMFLVAHHLSLIEYNGPKL
ncbi:hypothetical protein GB937_002963 [Aspergillus fischeri]|nr:hypothetical protein GB937_002963 [Aspergillus fischeri]